MTAKAILWAGLICGVLDFFSASLVTLLFGGNVIRTFQQITSGIIGPVAFRGGMTTFFAGVILHFLIAFGAAAVYYIASRYLPVLLERALVAGVLYGVAVHLFMQFVVIPLSAIVRRPITLRGFVAVLIVHMVVVGPSIALTERRVLLARQ